MTNDGSGSPPQRPPSVFFTNTPDGSPPRAFGSSATNPAFAGAPARSPQPALTPFGAPGVPRPTLVDPDPPGHLIDFVGRCHKDGKQVAQDVVLPWRALQLSDVQSGGEVFHEEPYLKPDLDDLELVHHLWERMKQRTRMYDDTLTHYYMVSVVFVDDSGHYQPVFETHDVPLVLPKSHGEYGAQTGMQLRDSFGLSRGGAGGLRGGRFGGGGGSEYAHAQMGVEMFAMNMAGIRENYGQFSHMMRMQQEEIVQLRANFVPVMTLFKDMMEDREKKLRDHEEWQLKMKLLAGAFEKSLPLLQYCGLQLMDLVKRKMDKRPQRTGREQVAFGVLKEIMAAVQKSGMAPTAADLWPMLQRMGIQNPQVHDDLMTIMMEVGIEGERQKAEASLQANAVLAGLLGGGTNSLAKVGG